MISLKSRWNAIVRFRGFRTDSRKFWKRKNVPCHGFFQPLIRFFQNSIEWSTRDYFNVSPNIKYFELLKGSWNYFPPYIQIWCWNISIWFVSKISNSCLYWSYFMENQRYRYCQIGILPVAPRNYLFGSQTGISITFGEGRKSWPSSI